jgi:hypothetical protein
MRKIIKQISKTKTRKNIYKTPKLKCIYNGCIYFSFRKEVNASTRHKTWKDIIPPLTSSIKLLLLLLLLLLLIFSQFAYGSYMC